LGQSELPERFVLLHPFSRGAGKSLSTAQVDELCDRLDGIPVVIAGRADDSLAQWSPPLPVINWLNRTSLPELIWLLRRADFALSVDSGPMHLAAAVSPRVLSLHTWSDPLKVGPYPDEAWAWKDGEIRSMAEWRRLGPGPVQARGQGEFPSDGVEAIAAFMWKQWEQG
jgi:ADP-heptose:LPS heptosyltransferase